MASEGPRPQPWPPHPISATSDPETGTRIGFFSDDREHVSGEEPGMRGTEPVTTLNGA